MVKIKEEGDKKTISISTDPYNVKKWWERDAVTYAFATLRVRARLELLMGSNLVRLTDRKYMQKLQQRIREDHVRKLEKRIHDREMREMDREKRLILAGYIPIEDAPRELRNHPVFVITKMTRKIIAYRRSKQKTPAAKALAYLKSLSKNVDTVAEPSELAEATGVIIEEVPSTTDSEKARIEAAEAADQRELDILTGYMFTPEEFDRLKWEDPQIKTLRDLETVDEMYALADIIVGPSCELFKDKTRPKK